MKKTAYPAILFLAVLFTVACTDHLLDNTFPDDVGDEDGIVFGIHVVEQADLLYDYGRTRAAAGMAPDSEIVAANTFGAHRFQGDTDGLQVHRMPLPIMGIHPRTVHATTSAADTRASLDEIVSDANSFHDSLTIWGCAYHQGYHRFLFEQILLKKIRGWRSSVHWPYDEGQTKYMKFCAISPSLEALDMKLATSPSYSYASGEEQGILTPPTFEYTIPDAPAEQRDVLFGSCEPIDVQALDKEAHLGLDDKKVDLTFQHILTAIRFAQGKMPTGVTIKEIHLNHIANKGVFKPAELAWTLDGTSSSSYTLYPDKEITEYAPDNTYIDGNSVLFLMPQTLGDGAELELVLNDDRDDRDDRHLTCSLKDDIWKLGYTVTYKVTIGELQDGYYLLVDPENNVTESSKVETPAKDNTENETKYYEEGITEQHSMNGIDGISGSDEVKAKAKFVIHSYRNFKDYSGAATPTNKHHAVGWKINGFSTSKEGTYDLTNNAPDWLQGLTGWESGAKTTTEQSGGDDIAIFYNIAAQTAVTKNHAEIIQGNGQPTAKNPMNLSRTLPNGTSAGTSMTTSAGTSPYNTANCYIVNAGGNYVIPMVYGNGIKNGNSNINGTFVDHVGRTIAFANIYKQINNYDDSAVSDVDLTSDEIKEGGKKKKIFTHTDYRPNDDTSITLKAEVVWQDVEGLVTATAITQQPSDADYGYIPFVVNTTNAQPGNAVIALKAKKCKIETTKVYADDGATIEIPELGNVSVTATGEWEVLWTWHIWVTDEVYPNLENDQYYPSYHNGSKISNGILPVNLGWVPDNDEWHYYAPRQIWVEIEQSGSGNKVYLQIRQEAVPELVTGTSTIYQWGRPTAFPMKKKIDGNDRTIYGSTPTSGSTASTAGEAISTPTILSTSWTGSSTGSSTYWSTTKTLYDPCPVGFKLPAGTDFSKFMLTGSSTTGTGSYLNMRADEGAASKGGYFYTEPDASLTEAKRYDPKVYIPATGYWTSEYAQSSCSTTKGYYWTSTSVTSWQVLPVKANNEFVNGDKIMENSNALPIRPVAE